MFKIKVNINNLRMCKVNFTKENEPKNTFNDRFLNEFIDKETGTVKLPFEHYVKFPTEEKDELATTLRRQYANYISNTLPKLAAVAGTEWTADFEQKGGLGMGMEMGMDMGNIIRVHRTCRMYRVHINVYASH